MKKLRWAMDGGFWDVDVSTPVSLDGVARPVPLPGDALPLGMSSRGARLSRPKQIDFFQRFMSMPFVPSYAPVAAGAHGFSLQHVLTFPFGEYCHADLAIMPIPLQLILTDMFLEVIQVCNFAWSVQFAEVCILCQREWINAILRVFMAEKHWKTPLQQILLCLQFLFRALDKLITPDDTVLFSIEGHGDKKTTRKKAGLHHKFLHHNLTVEAAWPELFVDHLGTYWDIPFSMVIDLASVASDSGTSYHFCINHNVGPPKQHEGQLPIEVTTTLLPGLSIKSALSFKKNVDIWRSKAPKLKMVQPFDVLL